MKKNGTTSYYPIGIDLGTHHSTICVFRNGKPEPIPDPTSPSRSFIMPSIVGLNPRGELVVGHQAKTYIGRSSAIALEVKRLMGTGKNVRLGDKEYRPEEISALILKQLKYNAEIYLGEPIEEVVLSVPANFPDAAKNATKIAGEMAGLKIRRLIMEPTAAALAFGISHMDLDEQLMVFDFGRETLDITIMEMMGGVIDVKCSYGDPELGGKDFDEVMMNLILSKFRKQYPNGIISDRQELSLKMIAEEGKIMLSTYGFHSFFKENLMWVDGKPCDLDLTVNREEFENASEKLIGKARDCLRKALTAKDFRPSDIRRIIMVGSSTYIPLVREMVENETGKKPITSVNPDLAVSMGASIQAAIISDQIEIGGPPPILTDVAPIGLGIDPVYLVGNQLMIKYDELIAPNTTIPYTIEKLYALLSTDQSDLEVKLYQDKTGEAGEKQNLDYAVYTGKSVRIPEIPPSMTDTPHEVLVTFKYNQDGIIQLSATIPATGQHLSIDMKPDERIMDNDAVQAGTERINELWKSNPNAKAYQIYIQKAKSMLPDLPGDQQRKLMRIVNELKNALTDNSQSALDDASDRLIDFLFELELSSHQPIERNNPPTQIHLRKITPAFGNDHHEDEWKTQPGASRYASYIEKSEKLLRKLTGSDHTVLFHLLQQMKIDICHHNVANIETTFENLVDCLYELEFQR